MLRAKQLSLFPPQTFVRQVDSTTDLSVVGLFAGIGGIELGLHQAGWKTRLLCEIDPIAREVLATKLGVPPDNIVNDIRQLGEIPSTTLLAGGFPCQDLSQAGKTMGINGKRSGLIGEVFRLLKVSQPRWLLLENVPFMLQLDNGHAMGFLATHLESMGYLWAYRVVDTRAFGLPHRRKRVIMIASRSHDPRGVLLNQDAGAPAETGWEGKANGFYWTEGLRGVGWGVDCVPTLKCGSTLSIPSPPAVWLPTGVNASRFVTPSIEDAERLQGFPPGWTQTDVNCATAKKARWRLVGNAVSVPVARWIGERLKKPSAYIPKTDDVELKKAKWPNAAWGSEEAGRFAVNISEWPLRMRRPSLLAFLNDSRNCTPLSVRAAAGFLSRLERGSLQVGGSREFLIDDLYAHIKKTTIK